MQSNTCLAYLDVLGFSGYVQNNDKSDFAAEILRNLSFVMSYKITEENLHPANNYDENLKPLVLITSITSFEKFLALSDSIFITSNDANLFIKQLSSLLSECFKFTAHAYKHPKDAQLPENVEVKTINKDLNTFNIEDTKWYPVIFRGGITYDEVIYDNTVSISGNKISTSPNIVGKAVVKAVELEKFGKGPKLFIDESFYLQLNTENQRFVVEDTLGYRHFLWPAYHFNFNDVIDNFIVESRELLQITVNLWKAYQNQKFAEHYIEYLKLVSKSIICVCDTYYQNQKAEIMSNLKEFMKQQDVDFTILGL